MSKQNADNSKKSASVSSSSLNRKEKSKSTGSSSEESETISTSSTVAKVSESATLTHSKSSSCDCSQVESSPSLSPSKSGHQNDSPTLKGMGRNDEVTSSEDEMKELDIEAQLEKEDAEMFEKIRKMNEEKEKKKYLDDLVTY